MEDQLYQPPVISSATQYIVRWRPPIPFFMFHHEMINIPGVGEAPSRCSIPCRRVLDKNSSGYLGLRKASRSLCFTHASPVSDRVRFNAKVWAVLA